MTQILRIGAMATFGMAALLVVIGFFFGDETPKTAQQPQAPTQSQAAPTQEAPAAASAAATDKRLAAALAAVKAEPKVIDAVWNDLGGNILYAGVRDDGTRRDGYAEYLAQRCIEQGMHDVTVYVVDYQAWMHDKRVKLGTAFLKG